MIKEQIPIIPGSMLSDISPNEMGENEHLEVVNLRRNRIGEWESVHGYLTILENSGYSGITTAIEVTDDLSESSDQDAVSGYGWKRFILYHDNIGQIRRIIYKTSGYDVSTDELVAQSGTISGVDVPASGIRFSYHNGIVRITGTTVPLWYGRIDRTWGNSGIISKKWIIDKSNIEGFSGYSGNIISYSNGCMSFFNSDYSVEWGNSGKHIYGYTDLQIEAMYSVSTYYHYYKIAFIYDDHQISLMQLPLANIILSYIANEDYYNFSKVQIDLPTGTNGSLLNKRLTGIALCIGRSEIAAKSDDEIVVYKVVDFVNLSDEDDEMSYKYIELTNDGSNSDKQSYNYDICTFSGYTTQTIRAKILVSIVKWGTGNTIPHSAMLDKYKNMMKLKSFSASGCPVRLYSSSGTSIDTTMALVPSITQSWISNGTDLINEFYYDVEIYFSDDISSLGTYKTLAFKRKSFYGSSKITVVFGCDNMDWDGYDYSEYSDIPVSTDNISPNYSHHIVIGDRAYVTSLEDEEEDFVRYSAQNKFDVFPDTNLISTGAGDLDRNMVIVARDDKFIILKRNSITQGQMTGDTYFQDTSFTRHGLYPVKGYIVLDHILYVMEKDDIYAFAGTDPEPLMGITKIREFYRTYIDANSYFAFDNQNNELFVILNGHVLVWNRNYNDWYIRLDDFSFTGYFNDSETRLIGYGVSGGVKSTFASLNHDSKWFSENINWSFRTKFQDNQHPELYKKLDEIMVWYKGNVGISYSGYDNQTNDVFAGSFPPSPSGYSGQLVSPFFLYHELIMTFFGTSGYSGMDFSMKKFRLNTGRWGNGI